MSGDEKLEAIDFIVHVLKEHEKDLDQLVTRLDEVVERIEKKREVEKSMRLRLFPEHCFVCGRRLWPWQRAKNSPDGAVWSCRNCEV